MMVPWCVFICVFMRVFTRVFVISGHLFGSVRAGARVRVSFVTGRTV